jgi:hypothetical protein
MIVYGVLAAPLARETGRPWRRSDKLSALVIMTVKGVDAQEPLEYVLRTFDRP